MRTLPDIISASRGVAAVIMLFFPAFSLPFWLLYAWCGISDMIDGPIARKMGVESGLGSRIDSLSDLVFVICAAILIIPSLTLPVWMWLWVAVTGMVKLAAICVSSLRRRQFTVRHSMLNKLTGLLLFCLPFSMIWLKPLIPSVIVCAAASFSLLEDILP